MSGLDRRHFFKKSLLTLVGATFAKNAVAASACETAAKKVTKKSVGGYSEEYVEEGKLGYAKESPESKSSKGKLCSNCKHYCEDKKICTLASMMLKKEEGGKKIKYFPKVHDKGYCNMFAWDKNKKKDWKKSNKKA